MVEIEIENNRRNFKVFDMIIFISILNLMTEDIYGRQRRAVNTFQPQYEHLMAREIFEILRTCILFWRCNSSEKENTAAIQWSQAQKNFRGIKNPRRPFATLFEIICVD